MAFGVSLGHSGVTPWFPSKRDTWVTALLWGAMAMMAWTVWITFRDPGASPGTRLFILLMCGGTAAFTTWALYGTGYGFLGSELRIHSGPFVWRVPLADVDRVKPTRNPLSGPAPSLDRLEVRYGGGRRFVLISPEDKGGFLRALAARAPQLEVDGHSARRVD